jgi:hypothetical protein
LNRVGCVAQVVGWAALAELRSVVGMFPDMVGELRCRWVWRDNLSELLGVLVEGLRVIRRVLEVQVSVSEKTRGLGSCLRCAARSRTL